jgi:hypothetical protein
MRKFKEGDEIVRTANFWGHAPEGWASKVTNGNKYIDKHGDLMQILDCDWELAEDTSKPVTVTHEGNVYEIGKYYLFRMHSVTWTLGILEKINNSDTCYFCTPFKEWLYIKEIPASEHLGTITPAPIELIDGNAYMFDYEGVSCTGVYEAVTERFYFTRGRHILASYCTNIRPMTVTESK